MSIRYILFTLSFLVISVNAAHNQLKQESYWDIQTISEPIIDPTGNKVIFAKKYIDKKNDAFISDLWVMDSSGSEKRFFVKGSNPQWSPDGAKIAFIKEDENKNSQIFVKHLLNGYESKITNFKRSIKDFAWSKDGKYFITASEKGTILRIYSIETLSLVKELRRGMDATTINDIRTFPTCKKTNQTPST